MARLKLDLHEIYSRNGTIEKEFNRMIQDPGEKRLDFAGNRWSGRIETELGMFAGQRANAQKFLA